MATKLEQEIDKATSDWRMRLALRLGALLEGGSLTGPWPSGDNGVSHGPFQINSSVHDVSHAQANDPAFAVRYMLAEYQAGVARVTEESPGLWDSDPALAAARAAFYAERPREMYPIARIRARFGELASWLAGLGKGSGIDLPGPLPDIDLPGIDLPGWGDLPGAGAVTSALAVLTSAATWRRVAAVVLGIALVFGGVYLFIGSPSEIAEAVIERVES